MIFNTYLAALVLLAVSAVDANNGGKNHVKVKRCTVKHNKNGKDDSDNILKAFKDCATNSVITFDKVNYNAYTPVSLTGLRTLLLLFSLRAVYSPT